MFYSLIREFLYESGRISSPYFACRYIPIHDAPSSYHCTIPNIDCIYNQRIHTYKNPLSYYNLSGIKAMTFSIEEMR